MSSQAPLPRRPIGALRPHRLLGVLALAAALVGFLALANPWLVNGMSMSATLQSGEVLLVERLDVKDLARGQVVIFQPPIAGYTGIPFVKRVIGLPGDTVSIQDGAVYLNGQRLEEPYVAAGEVTATSSTPFSVTVPAGSVFVLGDNREDSYDSRSYGPVPVASIVGRAWLGVDAATAVVRIL